ncbi:HTTM domain-containing protein [Seonamhaeicola sp. MEBiC1930]|uniref:hypothetical protein n=1 Tax=Seonamhaeicola sp. MEBiC01930 TaxID=2976768 RepID=UPI00324763DD
MCKLLVLLLIYHGYIDKLIDPFIPFIPSLDIFNSFPGVFKNTMRFLFAMASVSLFFNFKTRTSSLILGCVVIISILASIPNYYNHILICGCALVLAGLSNRKSVPYLLILQLSLVYFGASLHKILDADWWSGDFMHNWLFNARNNTFYIYFYSHMPNLILAKFLSITAFTTELMIAILLLFKQFRIKAVWFIIVFHMTLFSFTMIRFGHFIDSLLIVLIGFLNWPKKELVINFKSNKMKSFRKLISFFDFDNKIVWIENRKLKENIIKLNKDGNITNNINAIKEILLYSPSFYILLFIFDCIIGTYLSSINWKYDYGISLFIAWFLILFFSPLSTKFINALFFKEK